MTLVVTSVSALGVSVVGDKAASFPVGAETFATPTATKVYYSAPLNMSFAIWGSAASPGVSYEQWFADLVLNGLPSDAGLDVVSQTIAREINSLLAPLKTSWAELRRGIHVGGYESGVPCIYHVHTGAPSASQHELRVFRDFPDIHGGGLDL